MSARIEDLVGAGANRTEVGADGRSRCSSGFLMASAWDAALRLRAPAVAASTPLVRSLSVRMCQELGLDERRQSLVDLAAQVRDIGMIGLPDAVVLSPAVWSAEDWQAVCRHPVLGAEALERLSGMEPVAVIVRAHHERWDGEGYPHGLAGTAIPELSRVIAVADAFVAIATDRPHRRATPADIALEHIVGQRGTQLDPRVVDALAAVVQGRWRAEPATPSSRTPNGRQETRAPAGAGVGRTVLGRSLAAHEHLAAFTPACDNALGALAAKDPGSGGRLVAAVESDIGLTVAVLRGAQQLPGGASLRNVPDAVSALGMTEVGRLIGRVERLPFPWQTPQEARLHALRVHAQTVARAADRIAQEVAPAQRDDLITAALLHDVGKLVLADAHPGDVHIGTPTRLSPEQRVLLEQREFKIDHAALGTLLLDRWGLPRALSDAVGRHHRCETGTETATLLRLADMIAHHAHGDTIDRRIMLRLANACGLEVAQLRDVLFDLPQAGSQRRRAQPSPLSQRETAALRGLASGKHYKQIAAELDLSPSTIRTHLHNTYAKLNVDDRAQAVLRAAEMGWI